MKKIISLLLCIAICICLFACAEKTQTKDSQTSGISEESANKSDNYNLIYCPAYFKDVGITVVEWGERCEWIDGFEPPYEGKFFYTVNYINVFPYTFQAYENWDFVELSDILIIETVDDLIENRSHLMNFELYFSQIKNGNELMEIYDDILLVSEYQADNIKPGDTYIVSPQGKDVTKGFMFPVVDGHLAISDMYDNLYVANPDETNFRFHNILKGNDLIRKRDSDYPIFEDRTPISYLNSYFENATEKLIKSYWENVNLGDGYY